MRALLILGLCCLPLGLFADQGAAAPDLRKVRWSMTPNEVGQVENLTNLVVQSTNRLVFRETLAGFPVRLEYHFSPQKGLVFADYQVEGAPIRLDEAYPLIRAALETKYGKPREAREGRFGAHLHGECWWETDRTRIEILRSGGILRVRYSVRHAGEPLPKELPAADLEKL
jgi:hypothetical protein